MPTDEDVRSVASGLPRSTEAFVRGKVKFRAAGSSTWRSRATRRTRLCLPEGVTFVVPARVAAEYAEREEHWAGPGDIVVVGAETPHRFKNMGTERLEIICIHASPRMIQESLED